MIPLITAVLYFRQRPHAGPELSDLDILALCLACRLILSLAAAPLQRDGLSVTYHCAGCRQPLASFEPIPFEPTFTVGMRVFNDTPLWTRPQPAASSSAEAGKQSG